MVSHCAHKLLLLGLSLADELREYVSTPGKLSPYFPPVPPIFRIFCPRVGDTLLFENGYFDASSALGMWYIWSFTLFHSFFAHFHHIHFFLG